MDKEQNAERPGLEQCVHIMIISKPYKMFGFIQ